MAYQGCFITFEGTDGCGKTTQISLLTQWLSGLRVPLVVTREPGGTTIGAGIREILLHRDNTHLHPRAELLLYAADRAQHVAQVILPALARGEAVVCDRFSDATIAYQGSGRDEPLDTVRELIRYAAQGLSPDITILLDVDVRTGLARARQRQHAGGAHDDRFEREEIDFHERVRESYLSLARQEPDRFRVIDAGAKPETVFQRVRDEVMDALARKGFTFAV